MASKRQGCPEFTLALVYGGNRTEAGGEAQAVTLSVLATCKQQAVEFVDYVSQTLRGVAMSLFPAAAAQGR